MNSKRSTGGETVERALVLGAGGFIGSYLTDSLSKEIQVIGYGLDKPINTACSAFLTGDFVRETNWEAILTKYQIDSVYHLISGSLPHAGTDTVESELLKDVLPTIRLLEAMKNTGTRRIIFASSGGTAYGEASEGTHKTTDRLQPICSYGMQKITIESYMQFYQRLYGLQCVVARIANPYGLMPQSDRSQGVIPIFLRNLLLQKPITLYGETIRDYIYIGDVADALVKLGFYTGGTSVFNIGTGIGTGLRQLVAVLEKAAKKRFVHVVEKLPRTCDVQTNILDISETTKILQWEPVVGIEEGVQKTLDAIRYTLDNTQAL